MGSIPRGPFVKSKQVWVRYALSLLVFAVALAITSGVPALRENSPFLLFYGVVVASAFLWGMGPGLLGTGLSVISIAGMVSHQFTREFDTTDYVRLLGFGIICALVLELGRKRNLADRRLRESEQYFRSLIENTSDIITILGRDGMIRYESPSIGRLGYRSGDLIGHRVSEFLHPDDLTAVREYLRRCLETRDEIPAQELRFRHSDGTYRFFEAAASLLDQQGETGVVVAWRDVTDRTRAAESFRVLVESAPDGFVGIDAEGRIMLVNSQTERMFGYTREELLGSPLELLIPERLRRSHVEHRARYSADPQLRPMHARDASLVARRKDGSEFPAEISLSPIRTERGMLIAGIIRDITERAKSEAQRAELIREQAARAEAEVARQRFHDLVQNLEAIVWELDIESRRMTFVSRGASELLGYSTEAWLTDAEAWLSHVHEDDREKVRAFLDTTPEKAPAALEYRAVAAGGQQLWLRLIIDVLRNGQSQSLQLCGLTVDITELKQAEAALRVNEKLAATGRLAASIAHEINNPIAAVTNLLYLIETHPNQTEETRRYARLGQQETERMAHITRQMLGFYRDSTAPVAVSIPEILQGTLELYRRRLMEGSITVEQQFANVPAIHAFPGEMRQVFSNLLINAVEAVGESGRIWLKVAPSRDWSDLQRAGVRITFVDNGYGIQQEHLQHIFEPFFTTKGENGTGLGLWVSYGILRKHNGSIRVRSSVRPDRSGTVFSVFLPIQSASGEAAPRTAPQATGKRSAHSAS